MNEKLKSFLAGVPNNLNSFSSAVTSLPMESEALASWERALVTRLKTVNDISEVFTIFFQIVPEEQFNDFSEAIIKPIFIAYAEQDKRCSDFYDIIYTSSDRFKHKYLDSTWLPKLLSQLSSDDLKVIFSKMSCAERYKLILDVCKKANHLAMPAPDLIDLLIDSGDKVTSSDFYEQWRWKDSNESRLELLMSCNEKTSIFAFEKLAFTDQLFAYGCLMVILGQEKKLLEEIKRNATHPKAGESVVFKLEYLETIATQYRKFNYVLDQLAQKKYFPTSLIDLLVKGFPLIGTKAEIIGYLEIAGALPESEAAKKLRYPPVQTLREWANKYRSITKISSKSFTVESDKLTEEAISELGNALSGDNEFVNFELNITWSGNENVNPIAQGLQQNKQLKKIVTGCHPLDIRWLADALMVNQNLKSCHISDANWRSAAEGALKPLVEAVKQHQHLKKLSVPIIFSQKDQNLGLTEIIGFSKSLIELEVLNDESSIFVFKDSKNELKWAMRTNESLRKLKFKTDVAVSDDAFSEIFMVNTFITSMNNIKIIAGVNRDPLYNVEFDRPKNYTFCKRNQGYQRAHDEINTILAGVDPLLSADGCGFYLMPFFPYGDFRYINSYILVGKKLKYFGFECRCEDVSLANTEGFLHDIGKEFNLNGCDLYLMSSFPTKDLKPYINSYISVGKELKYLKSNSEYEKVSLKSTEKFLACIGEFNLKVGEKKYLSYEQANKLITLNGGHTHLTGKKYYLPYAKIPKLIVGSHPNNDAAACISNSLDGELDAAENELKVCYESPKYAHAEMLLAQIEHRRNHCVINQYLVNVDRFFSRCDSLIGIEDEDEDENKDDLYSYLEKAISLAQKLIDANPCYAPAGALLHRVYCKLALAYARAGNVSELIDLYLDHFISNPDNEIALVLAQALLSLDNKVYSLAQLNLHRDRSRLILLLLLGNQNPDAVMLSRQALNVLTKGCSEGITRESYQVLLGLDNDATILTFAELVRLAEQLKLDEAGKSMKEISVLSAEEAAGLAERQALCEKIKANKVYVYEQLVMKAESHDLVLMSALPKNGKPIEGKIYLAKQEDKLEYVVMAPDNKIIKDTLDFQVNEELTLAILDSLKFNILKEISEEKGHAWANEELPCAVTFKSKETNEIDTTPFEAHVNNASKCQRRLLKTLKVASFFESKELESTATSISFSKLEVIPDPEPKIILDPEPEVILVDDMKPTRVVAFPAIPAEKSLKTLNSQDFRPFSEALQENDYEEKNFDASKSPDRQGENFSAGIVVAFPASAKTDSIAVSSEGKPEKPTEQIKNFLFSSLRDEYFSPVLRFFARIIWVMSWPFTKLLDSRPVFDKFLDKQKLAAKLMTKLENCSSIADGYNLYLMPSFPTKDLKPYINSYILVREELRYLKSNGEYEDVRLESTEKFLERIKEFNLKIGQKQHLSYEQVEKLITLNGGHTLADTETLLSQLSQLIGAEPPESEKTDDNVSIEISPTINKNYSPIFTLSEKASMQSGKLRNLIYNAIENKSHARQKIR